MAQPLNNTVRRAILPLVTARYSGSQIAPGLIVQGDLRKTWQQFRISVVEYQMGQLKGLVVMKKGDGGGGWGQYRMTCSVAYELDSVWTCT